MGLNEGSRVEGEREMSMVTRVLGQMCLLWGEGGVEGGDGERGGLEGIT